ncbi:undecaprenyldiphospho-muramoylpentapeptide beta-N-acetylglucosaminyltransferase [Thermoleophilia bacterium SCSIO 60948]|nr:undecaprenyldiphospho-muramoylpentapeptide beta-N-acetylglucosaminyltransferase [Thermoleophilia bacterium SCSIO 60948]
MPRVVIAAGGTAGHVVPALAVADALRAEGAEVSFLGTRERSESELVPAAGYEIDFLRVEGIDRKNPLRAARGLGRAVAAVPAARRAIRRRGADVVVGGGGYVAAPAGAAAVSLGLPLVLTEADRHLGLANRLLARRAERVCLAFEIPGLEGDRYLVTGRPVPDAITSADRAAARQRFGITADDRCLVVFGGSQGARSINLAVLDAFASGAPRDFHVLLISGARDHELAAERLAAAGAVDRFTLLAYEPGLADALAAADLVLARSGASIFEIAAAGRPSILVPYPYATGRHQHHNADWMSAAGAAVSVEDSELSGESVARIVGEILGDPARLDAMAASARALARPDAAKRVADEVLAAAERAR